MMNYAANLIHGSLLRWVTIVLGVLFAVVLSGAAIVEYASDVVSFRDPLRELVRDLLWVCSGAWFLANALRFLDTMRHGVWRYLLLISFGGLLIWFGYLTVDTYLGYGVDDVSEIASISAAVFTIAIGLLALLSLLRRGSERADAASNEDEAESVSERSRVDVVRSRIWMLVTHPFRSIKRDPIRWSAIAGAAIWPTISVWSIYALLPQGIAMTCLVRYADTYKGSPSVRIVALVVATLVVWFNFAVTIPFTPLAVAWVGPALTLWTFSAVLAMFRPRNMRDGLLSHQGRLDDLDEEDADVEAVLANQAIEKV